MRAHLSRRAALLGAVAGLGVVAACTGGADTSTQPPPSPTPSPTPLLAACDLITPAEAATALSLTAAPQPWVNLPQECLYLAPGGVDSVNLAIRREAYVAGTEDAIISRLGSDKTAKVDGLGEAAFVYDIGHQVQYHVWVDGQYLLLVLSRAGGGEVAGGARALVDAAVSRATASEPSQTAGPQTPTTTG